ncbi:MAG: sigma-70 family RNA polymerase sigma factor [Planctomycetota bacterium]
MSSRTTISDAELSVRLDQLSTCWMTVEKAKAAAIGPAEGSTLLARQDLLNRYQRPIYRYLLATVKDEDLADDLIQKFAVLVLEGRLHRADAEKGKLRKYLKTIVLNLVRQHVRESPGAVALPDEVAARTPDDRDGFSDHWRQDLINTTFERLTKKHPVQGRLLRLRARQPELTSRELAEAYQDKYGSAITPANVRKSVQRGNQSFGQTMVGLVQDSLDQPDPAGLRAELKELDLLKFCKDFLET